MSTIKRLVLPSAIFVLVFTAASAIPVVAQDANLIRINVVVTEPSRDRKVRGLEKENFQVLEDDVAQQIVSMTPGSADGEYVLTYKSTNSAKDGKWRDLRANVVDPKDQKGVSVIFSLTVRIKSGYYAPSAGN